jgi:SAM-dependent methyltransferase
MLRIRLQEDPLGGDAEKIGGMGNPMSFHHKIQSALKVLASDGFSGIAAVLRSKYRLPIPQSSKSKWEASIRTEVAFWDDYFRTNGGQWADGLRSRLDPELPLQPRVGALIPADMVPQILDVGAGPLTCLGKKHEGQKVDITAVDPLADEYDRILEKYNIHPPIRTSKLAAEVLTTRFSPNSFNLAYARNCLDHSYNPEKAILQLIEVVKPGRYVLLEHFQDQADHAEYAGLHQWNFRMSADGDFLICSKHKTVNMTRKYTSLCEIACEIINEGAEGDWLITRIRKR